MILLKEILLDTDLKNNLLEP